MGTKKGTGVHRREERVRLSELVPHPANGEHRAIDREAMEALKASIVEGSKHHDGSPTRVRSEGAKRILRLDQSLLVNRQGNRILSGHRRVEALLELGQDWVYSSDITWVDYVPGSQEELARVVTMNSPQVEGHYTEGLGPLLEGLQDLPSYQELGLGDLMEQVPGGVVEDLEQEFEQMGIPDFSNEDQSGHKLVVHFESEEDKVAFGELIGQQVNPQTKYLWHPAKQREDLARLAYVDEDQDQEEPGE